MIGIGDFFKAGYSHYYLETEELQRAIDQIKKEIDDLKAGCNMVIWGYTPDTTDPLMALQELDKAPKNTVLILKNLHWFIIQQGQTNAELTQFIQDRLATYRSKDKRKVIVIVSSASQAKSLPPELYREFVPLKLELPGEAELKEVLDATIRVASNNPKFKAPTEEEQTELVDSMRALTKQEAENGLFYGLVKTGGRLDPVIIRKQKAAYLEGVAGVKYIEYTETFDSLRGYDVVKSFTKATASHPDAKGILLLGPPGTGKTHFGKALAGEIKRIMLTFEMAEMSGSLVGENEEKVRKAIESAKAMAPCIVFVDEIEKGLAGIKGGPGGYTSDSINKKAMAQFLKFLQDRPKGIYVIATCNDVSSLPPEYVRAERWDTAPFFIDLPNEGEREDILEFYRKLYNVKGKLGAKETEGWSGAEIRACCRLANIMGTTIDKTTKFIVPVSKTMEVEIDALRKWKEGRTIDASSIKVKKGSKTGERDVFF